MMKQETENRNTQVLSSFYEKGMEELRPHLLDPREKYPETYYLFEFNGVPFSALGGIQANSGQKKNGKTFVNTSLMAVALEPDSERVKTFLHGMTVPRRTIDHFGRPLKGMYVDTEMEKLNSAKVLRRVHWLCGWDMDKPNERLNVLWLRDIEDEKDEKGNVKTPAFARRLRLIRLAIEILTPDFVFIDGIRDIIGDFNNNEQSAALVGELMSLATKRNICIWCSLHMNPRPGNDDDSKMRGHLGTELGNKVSDTLASYKKKTPEGAIFTVKQLDARGKDLDDWQFVVTDDAGDLGIPKIIGAPPPESNREHISKIELTPDMVEAIKAVLSPKGKSLIWSKIRKELTERLGMTQGQADGVLKLALNERIIVSIDCAGRRTYSLNPDENAIPF